MQIYLIFFLEGHYFLDIQHTDPDPTKTPGSTNLIWAMKPREAEAQVTSFTTNHLVPLKETISISSRESIWPAEFFWMAIPIHTFLYFFPQPSGRSRCNPGLLIWKKATSAFWVLNAFFFHCPSLKQVCRNLPTVNFCCFKNDVGKVNDY